MQLIPYLRAAGQDLTHALRYLRRNPRYAAMITFTLAVCIGSNTAVFSIVDSVLLRPLPVPEADDVVLMGNLYPKVGSGDLFWSAGGDYVDRLRGVTALESQALYQVTARTLESDSGAERIAGMEATPSLFDVLRIAPARGRAFDASEGSVGNEGVIILSHALWQRLYGGDPNAIGTDLRLNGRPHEIVGVMPQDFLFHDPSVTFWIPLALSVRQQRAYHSNNWFHIGRLKPGASIEQVQAQVEALNAANLDRFPEMREVILNTGFVTRVTKLKDYLVRNIKGSLTLLWIGACLVLLIGALNAAGLVVARSSARTKELGTRLALGAGLGRLSHQILAENLALATLSGIFGLALAFAFVGSLETIGLARFPRASEVTIGPWTALFAFGVSVLAGLTIASFSIAHLSSLSLSGALRDSSRSAAGSRRIGSVRKALVVAQVSLTFVLLTGSALMLASFRELLRVEPGYAIDGILTAKTAAPSSRYGNQADLNALTTRALDQIRAIPGVSFAGATSAVPLSDGYIDTVILAEGYLLQPSESVIAPLFVGVTPGYFEAMGMTVRRGRNFDARDTADSPPVIIIDEGLAERFWPGMDPVGRRMYQPTLPDLINAGPNTRWMTVIGVVDRVRTKNLEGADNEAGAYYYPFSQNHPRNFTFAVKTSADPARMAGELRGVVAGIDPTLALFDIRTMSDRAEASLGSRRSALTLLLGFGGISLFLASVGLYGVLSYLQVQRRREVSIRLALGSTPSGIFGLFLREGATLVGAGVIGGLLAASLGQKLLAGALYGVHPLEPTVLALVALLLAAIALAAVAGPAWGAANVDPARALSEQ